MVLPVAAPYQVQFWNWLQDQSPQIQSSNASDHPLLMHELDQRFKASFPDFAWEITQQATGPWTFCVSARGNPDLFPQVRAVVANALSLSNWKIVAFRQAGESDASITLNGVTLHSHDVWCEVIPRGEQVDVTLLIRGLKGPAKETLLGCALMLLDNAIGEYASATKIAELSYGSLPYEIAKSESRFPLIRLSEFLAGLERSVGATT